jgi:hypothetical protein
MVKQVLWIRWLMTSQPFVAARASDGVSAVRLTWLYEQPSRAKYGLVLDSNVNLYGTMDNRGPTIWSDIQDLFGLELLPLCLKRKARFRFRRPLGPVRQAYVSLILRTKEEP